jgi:hypothetical protein
VISYRQQIKENFVLAVLKVTSIWDRVFWIFFGWFKKNAYKTGINLPFCCFSNFNASGFS